MPARLNLASFLDDLAADPGRPSFALRTAYRGFRWTARRARAVALAVSGRLAAEGVRPGDRVILEGPNSPEWCAAFLGIVARGAVAVPLDAGCSPEFFLAVARRILGDAAVIGATVNSSSEAVSIARQPVDYLGVGPVFGTRSKSRPAPALGIDGLRAIVRLVDRPVIAIGGVTADNAAEALAAGAHGVAVLSSVACSRDPLAAVRRLREAIDAFRAAAVGRG